MKYLLSMDGGGSKTAWLLTSVTGQNAASFRSDGCSHTELGLKETLAFLHTGIEKLLSLAGCSRGDILAAAFGIPLYGEYPAVDEVIRLDLVNFLSPALVTVYNDVELGFAGSLCLEEGIHLVAGTGAIVLGRNAIGQTARAGGWHSAFSDEGSGFWLGMQTLSLFTKQADGRIPRSALYSILRRELSLREDAEIISYYDNNLAGNRRKTAALQLLLKEAAFAGDPGALQLYENAAHEFYLSICGVYHALSLSPEDHIKISYSGGLFFEGNFILPALIRFAQELSVEFIQPCFTPVYGGILLAMQSVSKAEAKHLCHLLNPILHKEDQNGSH